MRLRLHWFLHHSGPFAATTAFGSMSLRLISSSRLVAVVAMVVMRKRSQIRKCRETNLEKKRKVENREWRTGGIELQWLRKENRVEGK